MWTLLPLRGNTTFKNHILFIKGAVLGNTTTAKSNTVV